MPWVVSRAADESRGLESFTEMSQTKQKVFKGFLVCIILGIFVVINLFPTMTLKKVECMEDYAQDVTVNLNTYLGANIETKKALMITSSISCDIVTLAMFIVWTVYGRSWRFPIAIVFVYLLKLITNALFKIRYPEGFLWEYPGFYSLTVPYGMSNNFHFTVHVALLLVIFQEFRSMKYFKTQLLTFVVLVTQSFLILCCRGAYSIDLFAALIFGHFFWVLGNQLSYWIDVRVFGLTFQERFPEFQKECTNCRYPINKWTRNSVAELKAYRAD